MSHELFVEILVVGHSLTVGLVESVETLLEGTRLVQRLNGKIGTMSFIELIVATGV